MYLIIKTILSALIIVAVSEIAKKYTLAAAIILSVPLTSILALVWLFYDTKEIQKVVDLSFNTILMTIPSIVFFIVLPIMLKFKYSFSLSIVVSILSTSIAYMIFIKMIKILI
tara:strand:- start:452 stop:790 length:339 start_codon:yes stop_codon:yes gene_type:complete